MSIESVIFWGGIGSLILSSFILRYLAGERMAFRFYSAKAEATQADRDIVPHRAEPVRRDDAPAAQWSPFALTVEGWRPVHKARRETAETVVWRMDRCDGADGADWAYAVTVDRVDRRCGDCVACMNDAIRWIQDHERTSV